jgi:hypothetical protein
MKNGKDGGMAIEGFSVTIQETTKLTFADITGQLQSIYEEHIWNHYEFNF